jgi:hypothetical protein
MTKPKAVDLHPTTYLKAAAWVPDDDPERPWDVAAQLAAVWIWERSETEGVAPLLVTNALKSGTFMPVLDEIARAGGHAAPLGKDRFGPGPVLAYVPDERSMKFALDLARGYSLAVVEGYSFPIGEWAAGAGAINLLTGKGSQSSIPNDVRKDLDHVVFFGGNNGWTGSHEKSNARTFLTEHVRSGRLAPDAAAGYVMAKGVSDHGAKRLKDLLAKL